MENLTPLQQSAQKLREGYKRAEEEKLKKQQDKLEIEGRELVSKFTASFPTLYSLLISSNVRADADKSAVHSKILLTHNDKQVSIILDRVMGKGNSWSLLDKTYKATLSAKDGGTPADKEDENRLIIAIEEILFNSIPAVEEQLLPDFQKSNSFPSSSN